ncbi:MAG TPA: FAD-dependent oxidoreductase [Acidimicrobiales bacterium]|nr:FAD-dependent oxidoreductase [Acidimicrobiales bacterium]
MTDRLTSVVTVGAGLAGLRACEALRQHGYEGSLTLVGSENRLPYDRPPLSKQLLAGSWDVARCTLKTEQDLDALGIELDLGATAERLDLATRSVALTDGRVLAFDGLVIATGAVPRPLPGITGRPDVLTLRDLEDALALHAIISRAGARLVIAGAGFIGLEVAATARGLGTDVVVVEPLAVPLERAVGQLVGAVCEAMHRDHGVDLRLGTVVDGVETGTHPGSGVTCLLSDGTSLEADALLVGIGVLPATSWLEGSGLEVGTGGLSCDASLTAAPGVVAAGDLARWPHPVTGESLRVEHRTNAAEQGEHAARSLLAGEGPRDAFAPVPYVWSDQYDHKIQVLGSPNATDETVVVDGSLDEFRFVVVFGRAGRLTGALGFSRPRVLMSYRPLLERGASFEEALSVKQS